MIHLEHVAKSYGAVKVLNDLNWSVNPGEFWGIIGPNGSGKTTLLYLISGAEELNEGTVKVMGKKVESYARKSLSQRLALLQQEGLPDLNFSVRDVLEMGRFPFLNFLGRDLDPKAELLIDSIMERLELTELADRRLNQLSGGQRQRVALGKVMVQRPQILLLDEPTTYLDIHYQLEFMDMISRWRLEEGVTVIAVMHDLNLAAEYCDRLLVLKDGSIHATGTPEEVLTPDLVQDVFGIKSVLVSHPDSGKPQLLFRSQGWRNNPGL